jgi:hypothetical protein
MIEYIKQAHWDDIYTVLMTGNPPLALQLLIVNLVFFLIFAFRRLRGKKTKQNNASYFVHGLIVFANAALLFEGSSMPYYFNSCLQLWHKFMQLV